MADQSSDNSIADLRNTFLQLKGKSKTGELLADAVISMSQAMILEMVPEGCPGYSVEDRKKIWEAASKSFSNLDNYCMKLERLTKWDPT